MTLYEMCVDAVEDCWEACEPGSLPGSGAITHAILATIRDNSPSPRTVDEMIRILEEGGE